MSERLDRIERILEENSKGLQELRVSQVKTDEQLNRLEKSHGKLSKEIRNFIGNYGQTVEEYFFS